MKSSEVTSALGNAEKFSPPFHPSNDPNAALIERILASSQFRTSQRLREFLLYIAECALNEAPEAATEQQIGMHVFHRPAGYNSSEDSIVRTHARLLRQKLAEYFSTEGADEAVIVEVPKGHYLPLFRARESNPPLAPFPLPVQPVPLAAPSPEAWNYRKSTPFGVVMGILLGLMMGGCGFLLARVWPKTAVPRTSIETFWAPFLTGEPPVLIYSNARFVGDSKSGLRYAQPGANALQQPVVDHYTGIGELASVYELTRLFDDHRTSFVLKRSLLVTWDEAKQRNLIFLGSPAENSSLNGLPSLTDFKMLANPESAGFENEYPRPGEQTVYSRPEHPLTMDYAVIALKPGVQSGKRTLMFCGLTTLGTQAAVEFASRKDTLAELLKVVSAGGEVKPFEALLAVSLEGGVPLQSRLVAVRVH